MLGARLFTVKLVRCKLAITAAKPVIGCGTVIACENMEFLGKYELRERITSGPIEVFLSQELRSGLSRLVHVLESKENSGDLSSQEILKLIRRWAPEPPGIILEAGRDP